MSSLSSSKSKTTEKTGAHDAKTSEVPAVQAVSSDDENTMHTCRSSASSNPADKKQSKVLRKKDRSTTNPNEVGVPSSNARGDSSQKEQEKAPNRYQSIDYPDLNYVLAIDSTHLLYDVRKKPKDSIPEEIYNKHKNESAIQHPTVHMRIISELFPWSIDVKMDVQGTNGVRVRDIWKALYDELQESISESEWAILGLQNLGNPDKRMSIQRAAQRRCGDIKKPCRIDWLGRRTKFCGMYRDDNAVTRMLHPSITPCQETWVASFSNHI